MDVRCEKCQTEYELDEARLKPGGVTVKCTNCGHMFKVRKRATTDVGTPATVRDTKDSVQSPPRPRPDSPGPRQARADSMFDEPAHGGEEAPAATERQWLIRLENGEQRSCRELATLQQWIIAGVVTRESLISRTGKTWKRLGDIADLGQYFTIADEARANRTRQASRGTPVKNQPGTIPGFTAQAAGGTILPDDEDEARTVPTPRLAATTPPPVPQRGAARTPPAGAATVGSVSAAGATTTTVIQAVPPPPAPPPRTSRPTPPPPPPVKRTATGPVPAPLPSPGAPAPRPAVPAPPVVGMPVTPVPAPPPDARATAMWASEDVRADLSGAPASGPFVGKLAAIPDEPAFAGRVRMAPGDESTFDTSKVRALDDDDDLLPGRRGSRAGMVVLVMALLVMGAAAAVVYTFVIRETGDEPVAQPTTPPVVATAPADAAEAAEASDAATPPATAVAGSPALAAARAELAADLEPRLRTAVQSLEAASDPASQALRAYLIARLAQDLQDRAALTADRTLGDSLRKDARQLVLDAATPAQRALTAVGDDPGANIAMASVLRLQGKPARDVQRYLDTARAKADDDWKRELALAEALLLQRDGKLAEARAAFAALDDGAGKLESSGDVRPRFHLALVLAADSKPAEARPLVEAVLTAQPEHAGAKALARRLETVVATSDPLPPEEGSSAPPAPPPGPSPRPAAGTRPGATTTPPPPAPPPARPAAEPAGDYDRLLARANALAESSCGKAMELYAKALEQKPNGVEALAGMGYCHIDAKQFASAFSKFRAALAVSPRYEPALRGVAEAYQQQGLKDRAIEAYKAYLDVYPDSVAAKRQLERLGGDAGSSPPPATSPPPPATPAPPPAAPAPPAEPAPEAQPPSQGSGSD